jgi:hypothetical protein
VDDAEAVRVSRIEVEGAGATALIAPVGGTLDGQTLEVQLAKVGGGWKVGALRRFADPLPGR